MLILRLFYKILLILYIIMPILSELFLIFAAEIVPISQLNFYFMEVTFKELQYLVTVVADDLLADEFSNFQDRDALDSEKKEFISDVSEEMYDKVHVLSSLLNELYQHRPIGF